MSFGWHPRAHKAALDGMLMLTLEERGAYNTCLDLIYDREGPIQDDPRWLAGWMGVSVRKWSALRAALIVKGKLFAVNLNGVDCLMNKRAAIELENQSERSRKLRENGAKGGRKTAETQQNDSKNNGQPQAIGSAEGQLKTGTQTKTVDPPTTFAPEWPEMLGQAKEAMGEAGDFTRPAMHHAADLRALVEPKTGEPCTWAEVMDAIRMVAMRQKAKGKLVASWSWVKDDALALRDKRLNAANPAPADVVQLRQTGPPSSFTDRIAAENAEARRRVLSDGK